MIATDFEFDGEHLKDYGFIICSTDRASGFETINSNPQLEFENVSLMNGKLFELTTAKYSDKITISFQICKFENTYTNLVPICTYELRQIKRWLNRPTYKRFKLVQKEWANIYMEGSFNISEDVGFDGKIYVLNLTFESNSPLAFHDPITYRINSNENNFSYTILDQSDEIGYIYPDIKIICLATGDLEITNSNENRKTIIKNCIEGEIITFSKNLILATSESSHKIQNDFNYNFFRISNSYKNRKNDLTFSIPVKAEITYSPYVKAVS